MSVTHRRTVGRRSCCSRERDFRDINLTAEPPLFAAFIVRWVAPTPWSCAEIIFDAWKGVTHAPPSLSNERLGSSSRIELCPTRPNERPERASVAPPLSRKAIRLRAAVCTPHRTTQVLFHR